MKHATVVFAIDGQDMYVLECRIYELLRSILHFIKETETDPQYAKKRLRMVAIGEKNYIYFYCDHKHWSENVTPNKEGTMMPYEAEIPEGIKGHDYACAIGWRIMQLLMVHGVGLNAVDGGVQSDNDKKWQHAWVIRDCV